MQYFLANKIFISLSKRSAIIMSKIGISVYKGTNGVPGFNATPHSISFSVQKG